MSEPFLGEIRLMAFNFAPSGWAQCNGQPLAIAQNQALFALLGTTYGGNGQLTFALPNLQGRTPIHTGGGHTLGEQSGSTTHTLTVSELPAHTHIVTASSLVYNSASPTNRLLAGGVNLYANPSNLTVLPAETVTSIGGSQPHSNMQPYLVISFCIALVGIFPSTN